MSSKRPAMLMAILLLVIAGYFGWPVIDSAFLGKAAEVPVAAPPPVVLPAANALTGLTVTRGSDGRWLARVDYAYNGKAVNGKLTLFQMVRTSAIGATGPTEWFIASMWLQPGTHQVSIPFGNPSTAAAYVTEKVGATLQAGPDSVRLLVDQRIQWPDPVTQEVEDALAAGTPEVIVQKAVDQIDKAVQVDDLRQARALLQALVAKSPGTDAAYVELARIAMKANWGPVGLRDAETLIGSARQINPGSANAAILLGYVHAHQGRFKEAEAQFAQAAASNPPNLWLWANWGESLAMQGKAVPAIEKYRAAVARPPTGDTYDRARWDAYEKLIVLLERRKDLDGIGALLKQRAQEYPSTLCFAVDHARFLVLHRADIQGAVGALRESPSPACNPARTREVQGLGYYVAWAQGTDPERAEALRQARAFAPVGPELFYTLASSDRGAAIARQLTAAGEKVGMRDNNDFDALSYALRNSDHDAARRLLRLGSSPTAEVGPDKMPSALIPVLTRDLEGIRLLQGAGVDYRKLRYQGTTALDYARDKGDSKLQQLLDPKAGAL